MMLGQIAEHLGEEFQANEQAVQRIVMQFVAAPDYAFHDIGIWTERTFDYLEPSVRAAAAWLDGAGRSAWTDEIAEAIRQHHKLTPWRGDKTSIIEPFRKADLVDVSRGLVTFGLPRGFLRALYAQWPGAGFHRRLIGLELAHLRKDPLHPLPMVRL